MFLDGRAQSIKLIIYIRLKGSTDWFNKEEWMMFKNLLLIAVISFVLPVHATISSGAVTGGQSFFLDGVFIKLPVPFTASDPLNTVGGDTFQNQHLYGFDEAQNITITSNIAVDILADGLGGGISAGIIPLGSMVSSHYIFFDPDNNRTQEGTISFDADIIGVITSVANLTASDFLSAPGVDYLNPSLRGLETGDIVTITGLQKIMVDWFAGSPGDYIRVLTGYSPAAEIPEADIPILPLWGFILLGLSLIGIRLRASKN